MDEETKQLVIKELALLYLNSDPFEAAYRFSEDLLPLYRELSVALEYSTDRTVEEKLQSIIQNRRV